jgi:hypothetical protein
MISESVHPLFTSAARSGRAIITKHPDNISFALARIRNGVPPRHVRMSRNTEKTALAGISLAYTNLLNGYRKIWCKQRVLTHYLV